MNARVGIIMGSDSDLPLMQKSADVLKEFDIPFEMSILSAHRTPEEAIEYARTAADRGLDIIIAGAGAAAHLPGVIAAGTILPVIGVPINATALNGTDALYAIVQMPSGIPVASVGIDGTKNAALLAVEMLAIGDDSLKQKLLQYKEKMKDAVLMKNTKLQASL